MRNSLVVFFFGFQLLVQTFSSVAQAEETLNFDRCYTSEPEYQDIARRILWAAASTATTPRTEDELQQAAKIQEALLPRLNDGYALPQELISTFQYKVYEQLLSNIQLAKQYFINLKKQDPEKLSQSLNLKIETLNSFLKGNSVSLEKGMFTHSPSFTEENIRNHEFYQRSYYILSTDGSGPLLWTYYLQQKIGAPKHLTNDLIKGDQESVVLKNYYLYKTHDKKTEPADISMSIDNALYSLEKEEQKLRKLDFKRKNSSTSDLIQNIKSFITTYSTAVGQTLARYPEFSPLVCKGLTGLNQDRLDEKEFEQRSDQVTALATAASFAIGASGVGLRVISVGLKEVAAKIATYAAGSGTFAALWSGGYNANSVVQNFGKHREYENAFLSTNNDTQALKNAQKVLEDLDTAYNNALWSFGFAAAGGFSMPRFALIQKYGSIHAAHEAIIAEKNGFFKNLTTLLNQVSSNPELKQMFAQAKNTLTNKDVDQFFVRIADLSAEEQSVILNELQQMRRIEDFAQKIRDISIRAKETVKTNPKFTKKIDTEQLRNVLKDIHINNLDQVITDLAKEFKVTEEVMMARFAEAKTTVSEIIKEIEAGTSTFKKVSEGVTSILKNPALMAEAFRNPKLLTASLIWSFKKRGIVNEEFGKIVTIFVIMSASTTTFSEKQGRGEQFWNQMDIFTIDLVCFAIMEIALVMTGSKTITTAETLLNHVGKIKKTSQLPANIFDNIFDLKKYSIGNRLMRFGKDGARLVGLSTLTTVGGYQLATNFLGEEEAQFKVPEDVIDQTLYLVTIQSFLFGSSNFRYHLISKSISEIERLLAAGKYMELRNLLYYSISIGNDVLGTWSFVKWQETMKKFYNDKNNDVYRLTHSEASP